MPGSIGDWLTDDLAAWSYRAPAVVADIVVVHDPASVLEVGCGTGLVGRALRAAGFAGELRGLDPSASSLEVARESGAYAALAVADLQQPLLVADDSVDAVACVGVMTYLPDVEAIWRELARSRGRAASWPSRSARTCGRPGAAGRSSTGSLSTEPGRRSTPPARRRTCPRVTATDRRSPAPT